MPQDNPKKKRSVLDRETYLKLLITIARADKENGPQEYAYIRKQAIHLGIDYEKTLAQTDKNLDIGNPDVSRLTALRVLKDAIIIASMDGNFTLFEKQKVYTYAEKLNIPRTDVDTLEEFVEQTKKLERRWQELVAGNS